MKIAGDVGVIKNEGRGKYNLVRDMNVKMRVKYFAVNK